MIKTQERPPVVLQMSPVVNLTRDEFFNFCQLNRNLRLERTAGGEIVIMSPAGGSTGSRNSELNAQLRTWAKKDGRGVTFDSSTGFDLPNGATRSPDAAWVLRSRLAQLSPEAKERFLPLCPDFVVELRSPSDKLATLQEKMVEYVENVTQLGWLIDPLSHTVYVYQPAKRVQQLKNQRALSGNPMLPGFVLDLTGIWEPEF
jgi:Uma2 family endonuclease